MGVVEVSTFSDDRPVLADYTTLGLGGPAKNFVRATTTEELVAAVRDADAAGEPVLILGGGSNLVVADSGFSGTVVHVDTQGVSFEGAGTDPDSGDTVVLMRAQAGVE